MEEIEKPGIIMDMDAANDRRLIAAVGPPLRLTYQSNNTGSQLVDFITILMDIFIYYDKLSSRNVFQMQKMQPWYILSFKWAGYDIRQYNDAADW